jgi:hypothetical protein
MSVPPLAGLRGGSNMSDSTVGEDFQKLCRTFNKLAWYLRLLAYVVGAVAAHAIGMFAVLGVDLYGAHLNRTDAQK